MYCSLRYRLLGPLAILLVGMIGISTWTGLRAADSAERRISRQLHDIAATLATANYPLTPPILRQMKGLSGAEYLLLLPEGERISTLPAATLEGFTLPTLPIQAEESPSLGPLVEIGGVRYHVRRVTAPARSREATLLIFYPEQLLREALRDAIFPSLVLGGFGGLMAVTLMLGIGRRIVEQVRALESHTRRIAAGDFNTVALPLERDELHDLSESVNEMAAKLYRLEESLKQTERLKILGQLSSGLAHQLRNNAAGARLAIQVHHHECPHADEALEVALRQMTLMDANLGRFLTLGEAGSNRSESVDLSALITDTVRLLGPRSRHARIRIDWQPPADAVRLHGDPIALGHLVLNLLTNALDAVGTDGRVRIECRADPDQRSISLEVFDSGPGPAEAIADRLFDAFVTDRSDGIGLGLTVAKQAVESHAGRIAWERRGTETCFYVDLPIGQCAADDCQE